MGAIATLGLGRESLAEGKAAEALELAESGPAACQNRRISSRTGRRTRAGGTLLKWPWAAWTRLARTCRKRLEIAESIRSSLAGADFRRSYFAGVRNRYDLLIDILIRQGRDAEAFAVSERSRARSLLELLAESRSGIQEGVDPHLLEREKQIRAALRVKIAAPEQDVQKLLLEYREVSNAIRAQNPRYAALTLPAADESAGGADRTPGQRNPAAGILVGRRTQLRLGGDSRFGQDLCPSAASPD